MRSPVGSKYAIVALRPVLVYLVTDTVDCGSRGQVWLSTGAGRPGVTDVGDTLNLTCMSTV